MHNIAIYAIGKKDERCVEELVAHWIKSAKKYGKIETHTLYSKKINQAQQNAKQAQKAYMEAVQPYLEREEYRVALHPDGEMMDTHAFAKMLHAHPKISFFIGGAYGWSEEFLQRCEKRVSLSRLTMSHKVAKIVLLEQIFRGLTILHHHPYHK